MHVSEVDYIIEGDHQPVAELPNPPPTEVDRAVARQITAEIEDGACLQIGIGGMPNAVCAPAGGERRPRPRHPHRDADRRHDRPLPAGLRHRRAQDARPRQARLHLRARLAVPLRRDHPQSATCCAVRSTTPTCRTSSCRTTASSRSTTRRRSTCRDRRRRSPTATATSAAPAVSCSSCAAPTRAKGGKSFICLASTYDKRGERRSRIVLEPDAGQHRHHDRART